MAMPPVPPQPPPPPPSGPPPGGGGGFGPPAGGGFGLPPDGGGWPPTPPPGRPPSRRGGLFALLTVIVALGAIVAVVLVATRGDDGEGKKSPIESTKKSDRTPTATLSVPQIPSRLPTGLPSDVPTGLPSGFPSLPTGFPSDLDSLVPSRAGDDAPYYLLTVGECFDISDSRPVRAAKKSCHEPHDAELVELAELDGSFATDAALKKKAAALCERPLQRKARSQPSGTVRGTLVQYPDAYGYKAGIDDVACSLAGDSGSGKHKLTKPLS